MTTKIENNNTSSKPSTLSNIKNMMKIGSDKLKEKVILYMKQFSSIFAKKPTSPSNQASNNASKIQTNPSNIQSTNIPVSSGITSHKKDDNNEAFKIEDDMENNDLSFHINNEEDDEEEEEVKSSEPYRVEEESKNEVNKNLNTTNTIKSIPIVHEKMMKDIEETDISTYIHKVFLKGSLMDIEGFPSIECKKIKKKNKILTLIGFGKNKKDELINYILVLDDNFIYFIKDENNNPDKSNPKVKKVGNRYNIRLLSNICSRNSETEKNVKIITLTFSKEEYSPADSEKVKKEFCFEENTDQIFIMYLNLFLTKINKPTINLS